MQLRIVDFAIIEEVELELHPRLNVLTGETGAGKSIIVGAAGLLRGGRASAEMVRRGADSAEIEAVFDLSAAPHALPVLEDAGLVPTQGDELSVRRVIQGSGRGKVYINGSLSTVAVLKQVGAKLLDISGQHEHQSLSERAAQLQILDALAGSDLVEMARAYEALREAERELEKLSLDEAGRAERVDFLRFQLLELEEAALEAGEDARVSKRQARLRRAHELAEAARDGEHELYSADGSVAERVARVVRRLGELGSVDEQLRKVAAQLDEARVIVEDAAMSLGHFDSGETDEAELALLEERLALIHRLTRKHGGSLELLLERQATMREELDALEGFETQLAQREEALARARAAAVQAASRLSEGRAKAARRLARGVSKHLDELCMEGARLDVEVAPLLAQRDDPKAVVFGERRLGARGWDRVELLIAANVGEPARPLAEVASGGELSRVMLALRQVIGEHDPPGTSIYDEVDAGVGGKTADVVGRSLARVAVDRQVLCVTHLPQVAAHADCHFYVGKRREGRRTKTSVERLDPLGRVEELARMLGSSKVTAQARANARALLKAALGAMPN
ncbi:MAG: DNA repair protein RecN [Myxococcales bacterium]|nr:DNA repair protein RecN [Myxococcales bacterium]